MSQIIQSQGGDPNVYLEVGGVWYRYDTTSPPLGEGAMGVVYLGCRCDNSEQVAIKQIRPEFWNNLLIRNRSKLEASIVLNHPHIIRMIGYCENDPSAGPLYVLSEYVSGITIEDHTRSQLSLLQTEKRDKKIVEEFVPIVEAASYLHSLGIIHRDIKPDNIMLQDGYLPKLMDLGIAKADSYFDAHLCGAIGSQPFAAPEQIVPDDVEAVVDNRSDIYSLGATLQYLISGSFPSDMSGHSELLSSIVSTATAVNPEDRYQDADLLKDALVSFLTIKEKNHSSSKAVILIVLSLLSITIMILFVLL